MKRNLLRLGLMSLMLILACIAKAQTSVVKEKALYTTDFTDWTAVDRKKATNEVVNLKTRYSNEAFTFTLNGVGISPEDSKFANHKGFMQTAKYTGEYKDAEPSAITSALANITKITLHQAATGGNRGIKVSVKGDGDEDWVALHNVSIATQAGEDLTIEVNRKNCQIKFESFALGQNAYVTDLAIYGNVELSGEDIFENYTLTYYDIDGKTVLGTQTVQEDSKITAFLEGVDKKVTVVEGKKFRGWSTSLKADEQKYTVNDIIKRSINLYALVTDVETASPSARYDFNLQKSGFSAEDHEAFSPEGKGKWHDAQHGWVFSAGDKIKLLMGGKGYIKMALCQYSAGNLTLTDPKGNEVATIEAKVSKDGAMGILQNPSTESGEYILSFDGTAYLHNLSIVNMTEPAFAQEGNWYTVKANDAKGFISALETANGANAAADAPRSYIFLPNGTYDLGSACLTTISGNNISIIGENMDKTIILNTPEAEGIGITATLYNTSTGLYLQDLTLKDAYPYSPTATGRAVCLQDKGTQTICKNVKMLSFQDTYYSNNNAGKYYFENAEIHGIVDFICGGGDAFFNKCNLVLEPGKGAYITASYTDGSDYGYVFDGCKVIGTANDSFTFGRSWGGTAKCAFLNTILDKTAASKIASTRWTVAGMNVVAKNLFEYNTLDEDGNVISPAENTVKFTLSQDNKLLDQNEYNTILTADQAANYTLDKVFTNWQPAELTAQQPALTAQVADGKLTWTGDAQMYVVEKNGTFLALTAEKSYAIDDASAQYSVRAANKMGGFNTAATATTGIQGITSAESNEVAKIEYFALDGSKLSTPQPGINIRKMTYQDGKVKTDKIIK